MRARKNTKQAAPERIIEYWYRGSLNIEPSGNGKLDEAADLDGKPLVAYDDLVLVGAELASR